MPYPNFPKKHLYTPLVTPEKFFAQHKKQFPKPQYVPESICICWSNRYFQLFEKLGRLQQIEPDTFLIPGTHRRIAVMKLSGIGAPHAVTRMEEWISFGTKRFVAVGAAGGMQKNLCIGDIVVCTKAIRDEGTSHHYVQSLKYAYPSTELTKSLHATLQNHRIPFREGASWTIDAPYRETVAEMLRYQKGGVLTVEMEASALFAVARVRKVQLASLFVLSDNLSGKDWEANFHAKRTLQSAQRIIPIVLEVLKNERH